MIVQGNVLFRLSEDPGDPVNYIYDIKLVNYEFTINVRGH